MPKVECPHCGKRFEAPKELVGLKAKCSNCGKKFPIVFAKSQETEIKAPSPSQQRTEEATSSLSLTMLSVPKQRSFSLVSLACALAALVGMFVIAFLAGMLRGAAERAEATANAMQVVQQRAAVVEQDSYTLDREIVTLTAKLREAQGRLHSAESKLVEATKGKEAAHSREVAALHDVQKMTQAATQREKECEEVVRAHIGRLGDADRETWRKLLQKAQDHTLTFDEYRVLERLLGGDLAFLANPKLREIRNESIRRLAKEDPSQEAMLRALEPQAFATGTAAK